ncbi:hypothetical protein [Candidatus Burkholderia verschuerenii]|uniref:hypothetical protein n=1 Tax=Candidatus Burkholderia verschuerenii TaxID=242163 RepID=UPI00067C6585|nr:hypothetical protein [Candidatus Burkholderia verschuerenii]
MTQQNTQQNPANVEPDTVRLVREAIAALESTHEVEELREAQIRLRNLALAAHDVIHADSTAAQRRLVVAVDKVWDITGKHADSLLHAVSHCKGEANGRAP